MGFDYVGNMLHNRSTDRAVSRILVEGNIMTKSTETTSPAVTRDAAVGKLIKEAGRAASTMVEKCKAAARGAAKQLRPSLPLPERIKEVMSAYAKDFEAAGHNVRAVFGDALLLLAAETCPVVIDVVGKDNKKTEERTTAAKAIDASKHAMRDAAKQVRAAHGMGRKVTSAKAAAPDAPPAPDMDAFSVWLDHLPEYVTDAVHHARVVAALSACGFVLTRAAPSRRVKGAAASGSK